MGTKLTKRVYLGDGYHHEFLNLRTNEHVYIQCSQKEYEELATKNLQPTLDGHEWLGSTGGTFRVDTPDGRLGINEYCDINADEVLVRLKDKPDDGGSWVRLPKTDIEDDEIKPK